MSDSKDRAIAPESCLRVAIIGMGERAALAQHLASTPFTVRVTAVAEPDPARRMRAAMKFPSAQIYSSHHDVIRAGNTDAVIICTPDWTHATIATDFIQAGIAVFLEKPLGITLEEADALLITAACRGTLLYVGHNFRHTAVVRLMRDIIDRGEIGNVKAVWCRHFVGNGGDYYFKDWHADQSKVNSLLLQKGSHDIDAIHFLAGGYTQRVVGMGSLSLYGRIGDRRDRRGELASSWFSYENWPPETQTGLNPVIDVEDLSMMMMQLDNGVLASYEQCHYTPDYWRNYTVIGTAGRLENFGDTNGGVVRVWNQRTQWSASGDEEYDIDGVEVGHDDADRKVIHEFVELAVQRNPHTLTPLHGRAAVGAAALATVSLRIGSIPQEIPPPPLAAAAHFRNTRYPANHVPKGDEITITR